MKEKKIYIFSKKSRAANYGIGTYIYQLTNCLKELQIEFEVVYLHSSCREVEVTEDNGYKQISIPTVSFINKNGSKYYARNVVYLLKNYLPEDKDKEYIFHLNFMDDPDLIVNLKKMFKYKIILAVHYMNWSFDLLGDEEKIKNIMNKKYKNLRKTREKQIYKAFKDDEKMIKKCDILVCVAQHTLHSLIEICNVDRSKCYILNNGLKDEYTEMSYEEKEALRNKYFIEEKIKIILFAGRLDEVKGVSFLISAFKKVLTTNPDVRLIIAGDGNFSQWIMESKDYWSKISFTGKIDKEQLYELYKIADVGVVCSLHEEFGLVAIEMMMHKLPIVATDTGGLAEIIEDKVFGLKVPVKMIDDKRSIDVDLLAEKITALLDNTEVACTLGKSARKRFLEKYEISVFKENIFKLYQTI